MGGGGGAPNGANFELNLVPFIDLFSTLICFLLMTAAWQELDAMSNNVPPKAAADMPDEPQPPPPPGEKKVMLTIALDVGKIQLFEDEKATALPDVGGEPDVNGLKTKLADWKSRFPERKDVILATDNKAKYKYLILMMDTLIAAQFPDVGLNLN